jgi:hypothetical protein
MSHQISTAMMTGVAITAIHAAIHLPTLPI